MFCNFQTCVWYPEVWYFTCEKWPKLSYKIDRFTFILFKKFAQFLYKYFYKLWVLADIFCAKWIFLTCCGFFYRFLNIPNAFGLITLLFQLFPCLSSPMTPQSYWQHLKIFAVKKLLLQYLPGERNFSGLRVITKIVS